MRVVLSHRIGLVPTAAQEVLLRQAAGVARFAYNWAHTEVNAHRRLVFAGRFGQLHLNRNTDKPAVRDAPDRGGERFAGEAQLFSELHSSEDRQAHSLAAELESGGAVARRQRSRSAKS